MNRLEADSSAPCLARNCFESRNETNRFARNDLENARRGQRIRQKVESLMSSEFRVIPWLNSVKTKA
jgi:hypothetical protein